MKKFLAFLSLKGVTEADFKAKSPEEMSQLYGEFIESVATENDATKNALQTLKTELDTLKGASTNEVTKSMYEGLKERIDVLADKAEKPVVDLNLKQSIKEALLSKADQIKTLKDNPNGNVRIEIKAVAAMTFATHATGNVGRVERESGFGEQLWAQNVLLNLVDTSNTTASTYEWIEKSGKEGGVTMVAEGGLKPQGDWNLSVVSQKPKKDALIVTISKEMLEDIDGITNDIYDEIQEQIRQFTDKAILDGDGNGNNIEGLDANATAFTAGSFANTVIKANNADCLRVAINQVVLNNDYPTAILMHPSDATAMELDKTDEGVYVLPPFATVGGTQVKGLPIVTSSKLTQGEAYVGNFKRYKAKIRENITLDVGYRGAQGDWEKNMVSFLGEQRFFGFIRSDYYGSIVKIDFDVAKALLDPDVADS